MKSTKTSTQMDTFKPEALADYGLGMDQARVYYHLLSAGAGFPAAIAQATKIPRPTCYRILDSLHELGLVHKYHKGKRYFYDAANPKNLRAVLEARSREATQRVEQFAGMLPGLQDLFKQSESLHNIEFYEGIDKYPTILYDALEHPIDSIYNFIDLESLVSSFRDSGHEKLLKEYVQKRVRAKVKNFSLIPKRQALFAKEWFAWAYKGLPADYKGRCRYLDDESIDYPIYVRTYHDRVAFLDFGSPKRTSIVITNPRLSHMLRDFFKFAWKTAKPV